MDLKCFLIFFDRIDTGLFSLIVGSIVAGAVDYKIGAKGASKQIQKEGISAEQN